MINLKRGIIKDNSNKFAAVYRLIDIILIHSSIFLATILYQELYTREYFVLALIGSLGFALVAESLALYRSWRVGTLKELMFYTFISWIFAASLVVMGLFFTKMSEDYSRVVLGLWFIIGFTFLIGWRIVFKTLLHSIRKRGHNTRKIALFGLSEKGIRLAHEAQNNPGIGFRLDSVYDDRSLDRLEPEFHKIIKGNVDAGIEAARNNEFDVIYIALPINAQHRIQGILEAFGDTTATVHVVPDLFMYCLMHGQMSYLGDIQTISVYDNPMSGGLAVTKRLEDIVFSICALTILIIPMLCIAAAIKFTSQGKVLFKQDRYGLNGRKIKIWKFRTMSVMENAQVVKQASKDDPRITKFGSFLRRTSLDELPQFINVLTGDMSVVGPRPHAVAHNEEFRKLVSFYMLRHKVKPGITGWAQVNGWRGETDTVEKMKNRIEYDLEYIRNWSLWLDFKIIVFTMMRSFTDKNAY